MYNYCSFVRHLQLDGYATKDGLSRLAMRPFRLDEDAVTHLAANKGIDMLTLTSRARVRESCLDNLLQSHDSLLTLWVLGSPIFIDKHLLTVANRSSGLRSVSIYNLHSNIKSLVALAKSCKFIKQARILDSPTRKPPICSVLHFLSLPLIARARMPKLCADVFNVTYS